MDDELQRVGTELDKGLPIVPLAMPNDRKTTFSPYRWIAVYHRDGSLKALFGNPKRHIPDYDEIRMGLQTGKTSVVTYSGADHMARVLLAIQLQSSPDSILVAGLDSSYLWSVGVECSLPPMTDLCVIDSSGRPVISSIPDPSPLLRSLLVNEKNNRYDFSWENDGAGYIANYYRLFLQSRFAAKTWIVVLSQSKKDLLAPLDDFKVIFPGVALLSLLVVGFLSMYYIRHTLVPLEKIKEGIRQVSSRNFDTQIAVTSNDEFQELAQTFNNMASQLGKQFRALNTKSEIDRSILSSLGTEHIINSALTGIQGFLSCESLSIVVADPGNPAAGMSYASGGTPGAREAATVVRFSPSDLMELRSRKECLVINDGEVVPGYVAAPDGARIQSVAILPVFVKNRLSATINLVYAKDRALADEDILHARQFADQMAVALSNASLVEELDQLNWGTLKALARTVDAKSSWTAGHSERVCEIALQIGKILHLSDPEMSILHRASLLHDIGKVGIPNKILDKPGKLTEEEFDVIRSHPGKGAIILEPITTYRAVIPAVHQHHEKFNGTGYPNRLRGEQIDIGARIIAVADVFDAMTASRPYRVGMDLPDVLKYIETAAGSHFDPDVTKAFLISASSTMDGFSDLVTEKEIVPFVSKR
ncbi:MAG: HD domain-containing protein [Syntrophobacteraceae bacterium]|nr:HD domain-containing protein [Syntrophobacteraceae bacterium]